MNKREDMLSQLTQRPFTLREQVILADNLRAIEQQKRSEDELMERLSSGRATRLDKILWCGRLVIVGLMVIYLLAIIGIAIFS